MTIGSAHGRGPHDIATPAAGRILRELGAHELARAAIARSQCIETRGGMLALRSESSTEIAARDRYIVKDELTRDSVAWGPQNQALDVEQYQALATHLRRHFTGRDVYVMTRHAGGPEGLPLRVLTTSPAHALFCRHLFQPPVRDAGEEPLTVLHSPDCPAIPGLHGTASGAFVVINMAARTILIGGTGYAGELKKAVFSYLNFTLPARGILTLHAAANVGDWGDSAVFFGASGTGKTTLSVDPERHLLGDDEHAWSESGLFNLEGGCYAKTIGLSASAAPDTWHAVHTPLTLLENVAVDPATREIDWDDASISENARAAYPLGALGRVWLEEVASAPEHVVFLTADAFGVLPPVAKLSPDQAIYYFLAGYTATLSGNEAGQVRPQATFNPCFGASFMPRPPRYYARLLRNRIAAARSRVWLVNTGWAGGPFGQGLRMPIDETRCILRALLSSALELGPMRTDPHFGWLVPEHVPGVRPMILDPRRSHHSPRRYDEQARTLLGHFEDHVAGYWGW
jgi:phosphoenolpyruvate carboxykinase (ATP)